jgi:hypothetical protein
MNTMLTHRHHLHIIYTHIKKSFNFALTLMLQDIFING